MKKSASILLILSLILTIVYSLTGCARNEHGLNPKNPITLTMWHNYGGTMQKTMDQLIDEFNSTRGKEKGIIINVTAITSSSELQETLNMIINDDPGAPEMPDITTAYPKSAILFQKKGLLANLDTYFTTDEISAYIPAFVEEGRFEGGGLYVFPIAKSTEIIYLNQTLFDRFAVETNVSVESLHTFEGIADVAIKYYEWTDAKTPEIPDDGKAFFSADSWLNIMQAAMLQQGTMLFENETLSLENEAYKKMWNTCYEAIIKGGFAIFDGYSSDLSKTGDLVCSTGSSAGILFYGDTITHADGTVENVEYNILPYPTIDGGTKTAIQRGNGLIVRKSDKTREYASSTFLKWLTDPKQNMRFISQTGYLPVTHEVFENKLTSYTESVEDIRIQKMLTAVTQMYNKYDFFVAPVFENFDTDSKAYEAAFKAFMTKEREAWLSSDRSVQISLLADKALLLFIQEN